MMKAKDKEEKEKEALKDENGSYCTSTTTEIIVRKEKLPPNYL